VPIGSWMLVEVDDVRTIVGMTDWYACLLTRLSHRCILWAFIGLNVTSWLQPTTKASVKVQQEHALTRIEHDGGGCDVHGQRGSRERILCPCDELAQPSDCIALRRIDRLVRVEDRDEVADTRVPIPGSA